jgi:hypothetical protein
MWRKLIDAIEADRKESFHPWPLQFTPNSGVQYAGNFISLETTGYQKVTVAFFITLFLSGPLRTAAYGSQIVAIDCASPAGSVIRPG